MSSEVSYIFLVLSAKAIWLRKDNNVDLNIKWKILKQAKDYNNISNRCNLCLLEKYFTISRPSI